MESIVKLHIEKLPEGVYLATCEELPGLVAQGRTVAETIEIARDVARKLIEAGNHLEASGPGRRQTGLSPVADVFDYPLVVGA